MFVTQLLLLSILAFCCNISVHAFPEGFGPTLKCQCIRTSSVPVAPRLIRTIKIQTPGASCRQTEIIITKKDNSTVCFNPDEKWIHKVISKLQRLKKQKRSAEARPLSPH
ncbi:interleukin-8 [Hypomesus transpacificus]|uniref:interleukin-8 n=1 Tax=Hypomesus transpacificus TaxID=137520 RepID=UPI001F08582F|nr:interleukin-8 [Hypomesus transpacificus]